MQNVLLYLFVLVITFISFIHDQELDDPEYGALEKSLEILVAMERVSLRSRQRRWMQQGEEAENETLPESQAPQSQPVQQGQPT